MPEVGVKCDLSDLGPKGIGFIIVCILIFVFAILSFFGETFGIILGVYGIALALLGIFCVWTKNLKGLLIFIPAALLLSFASVINLFVLALGYRSLEIIAYIGAGGLVIFPVVAAYLAYDGRGKTLAWSGP